MSTPSSSSPRTGPIRLGPRAHVTLRPTEDPVISDGFRAERHRVNTRVGIPQGPGLLESAGDLHDLRLAAGTAAESFRGDHPFMDADVYKWLEAASWQLESQNPNTPGPGSGGRCGTGSRPGRRSSAARRIGGGIQLHRDARGRFRADVFGVPIFVSANTDYPWDGRITATCGAGAGRWPALDALPAHPAVVLSGLHGPASRRRRGRGRPPAARRLATADPLPERGRSGDRVVPELAMEPRLIRADPRVDVVRGRTAIERSPVVYRLEEADNPGGLDDVVIDTAQPLTVKQSPDLLGGVTTVLAVGRRRALPDDGWWPDLDRSPARATPDVPHTRHTRQHPSRQEKP